LDAIEKAIRNAFEKGNAEDRSFREKVYRSAFAALDRALQANPGVTVETAINRRKAMQAKIAEIESEFLPAIEAAPQAPPQVVEDGASEDEPAPVFEATPSQPNASVPTIDMPGGADEAGNIPAHEAPALGAALREAAPGSVQEAVEPPLSVAATTDAPRGRIMPVVPDIMPERPLPGSAPLAGSTADVAPDRDERRARGRRRGIPALFVGLTMLVLIAIGAWWLFQAGVFKTLEERGQLPSPPATVEDEDFTPSSDAGAPQKPGQADTSGTWITVFTPKDPTLVNAPADAKADVMEDDTGSFLRMRSGSSGSAVSFDVGQGILEQLAGKHAVFVISARAEEGQETQLSVNCNFGELGDCGRKRYAVGHERNEYLFDVEMPDKQPGAAGTIAINSDFENKGKSVDIYEIRVSPAD
jgi:hypothetical protein